MQLGLQKKLLQQSKCVLLGKKIHNIPYQNNQPISVPLKICEYDIQIVNTVANINLTQSYINSTEHFLEVTYKFPIPSNACVYRFIASFGSYKVQGIVKEKEEAKKEYHKAVSEGKQAAYGQVSSQSKDIMSMKIGNIGPLEEVKIQIVYLQQLKLSNNMFYQFHLMGNISPRYMQQIPKQHFYNHFRNFQKKAKGEFYWNFTIKLISTHKINFFESNTHKLEIISHNDQKTQYCLSMDRKCLPNKDFVLSYSTQNYNLPSCVLGRTDISSTAVLSFVPKFCDLKLEDAYKAFLQETTLQPDIDNARGQYIFLIDRSGSMEGKRIKKAKQALILFLQSLPQNSYFNVYSFGNYKSKLFPNSVSYSNKQVQKASKQIDQFKADMGGTKIFSLLQSVLSQKPLKTYPRHVFLLTDGQVNNTEDVIQLIGANNKYARIHTIGIGNGTSQALIVGCANKGKGQHTFITDQEDPSEKIIQLLTNSLSPVINKMKLSYDKNLIQSIIPNPQSMPFILKDQIVSFYITFKGQLSNMTQFEFSYQDPKSNHTYTSNLILDPESTSYSFIDKISHFKKIRLLQESYHNSSNIEQLMYYVKITDKKKQVINESIKHQILSQFTAFVCVQKDVKDQKYYEILDKGKMTVNIEQMASIQKHKNMNRAKKIMSSAISTQVLAKHCPEKNMVKDKVYKKDCALTSSSLSLSQIALKPSSDIKHRAKLGIMKTESKQSQNLNSYNDICLDDDDALASQQNFAIQQQFKKKKVKKEEIIISYKKQISKQQQKKVIKPKIDQIIQIKQIISQQQTQGCWINIGLISSLFSDKLRQEISKKQNLSIIITYLIIKWIQKNYPQKQYSLVIKKGQNYLKKNSKPEQLQNLNKLFEELIY